MKVVVIVIGALIVLAAAGCATGGGALAAVVGPDGEVESGRHRMDTTTYALVSEVAEIAEHDPDAAKAISRADVRIRVEAESQDPSEAIFIGVGRSGDVDQYLSNVRRDVVNDIGFDDDFDLETTLIAGSDAPAPPSEQDFWVEAASGPGTQRLDWEIEQGSFRFVLMNADGSEGVDVNASLGVKIPYAFQIGLGIMISGIVFALVGVLIIVMAIRSGEAPPPRPTAQPAQPPPPPS
jgi:hypothetical protein